MIWAHRVCLLYRESVWKTLLGSHQQLLPSTSLLTKPVFWSEKQRALLPGLNKPQSELVMELLFSFVRFALSHSWGQDRTGVLWLSSNLEPLTGEGAREHLWKYFHAQIKMQGFAREHLFPLSICPCLVCWCDDVLTGSILETCDFVTKKKIKSLYMEVDGV